MIILKNIVNMRKKLTIILLLLLICGNLMAQHISFMGIQMDGTLEEFSQKLETRGFKKVTKNSMKGNFAGYYCTLVLSSTNGIANRKDEIVANVKVKFNEYQNASPDIFHNLSKWLTVKYGAYEQYPEYYLKEENGYRVCQNRAWYTPNGTIVLKYGLVVELTYMDRIRTVSGNDNEILNDL